MSEPLYAVVFDGTIDPSRDVREVKENLAALFKKDVSGIAHLFSGKPVTLKKNLDAATAEKYKKILAKAGATCRIVTEGPVMQVINLVETGTSAVFPALKFPSLSSTYGGISLNRMDVESVPISDLILLSVFTEATGKGDRLVLFIKKSPRPFITDVARIRFKEFPGVVSLTVPESLKNFIHFLYEQNNRLAVDTYTHAFLTGADRMAVIRNVEHHINSLGRSLAANQAEATPAADSGVTTAPETEKTPVVTPPSVPGQPSRQVDIIRSADAEKISNPPPPPPPPSSFPGQKSRQVDIIQPAGSENIPASPPSVSTPTQDRPAAVPPVISSSQAIETNNAGTAEQYFQEGQVLLVAEDGFLAAIGKFEKCIELEPDHWKAHHAIAAAFVDVMDSEGSGYSPTEKKTKALFHAQKAVEHGGSGERDVVKTLAAALAENGSVEQGLLALEEAYDRIRDKAIKENLEKDIDDFRLKHDLFRLWQFFDGRGNMVFESTDIHLIKKRLIDGGLNLETFCRKNRVGAHKRIEDLLAREEAEIEVMVWPVMFHLKNGAMIGAGITGGLTGLFFVGKFLIYYVKALPGAFAEWIHMGLQNIVAFVAAIILLGIPSLVLALIILGIVIAVIAGGTGLAGAIPGAVVGGLIGLVVGIIRAPFIPKVGSGSS